MPRIPSAAQKLARLEAWEEDLKAGLRASDESMTSINPGLSGALLQLGQASLEAIPGWVAQIEADSGLACGLRPCGIVVPFASAAERDAYPTTPWGEALDRDGLEREVPGIGPQWRAGLLFRQDGQIDNRRRLMRAAPPSRPRPGPRRRAGDRAAARR